MVDGARVVAGGSVEEDKVEDVVGVVVDPVVVGCVVGAAVVEGKELGAVVSVLIVDGPGVVGGSVEGEEVGYSVPVLNFGAAVFAVLVGLTVGASVSVVCAVKQIND